MQEKSRFQTMQMVSRFGPPYPNPHLTPIHLHPPPPSRTRSPSLNPRPRRCPTLAPTLPLQQAKALDGALWAVAAGEKRMAAAGPGRGAMPEELLRVLSEAEASYEASAEGRAAGA